MNNKNKSGIWPVGYRVLVKPDPIEEKTEGGIILTDGTKEEQNQATFTGEVVDTGFDCYPAHETEQPWCHVGDRVMFAQHQGEALVGKDNETYRIINDKQVIALIDKEMTLSMLEGRRAFT